MREEDAEQKAEKPERNRKVGGGTAEDTTSARQALTARGDKANDEASLLIEEVLHGLMTPGRCTTAGLNSSTRTVGRSSPHFLTLTPSVSSRVGPNLRICRSQPGSTRRQTTRRSRLAQERRWSHRTTWRYPRVASLTGILPDPISTPPRPTPGSRGAELSSKSDWSLIRRSIRMAPSCAPKHERELTKCRDFVSQNL